MGGLTDGTDVLSLWLASRQPTRGERVAAPTHQEPLPRAAESVARAAPPTRATRPPASAPAPAAQPPPQVQPPRTPRHAAAPPSAAAAPSGAAPTTRAHPLAPKPVDAPSRPDVEFARRDGTQRLAGGLLLASLAGTAVAGWVAWDTESNTAAGVSAIGLLLTVGLWFLRAASVPPRVRIVGGVLQVEAHGDRHTWDLTNPYVRLAVRGRVGRPGWQVLLLRPEQQPYVVDASVVNPREFMGYLRSYRPEL